MIDARTVEERITELAYQAGLTYRSGPRAASGSVAMPGFTVHFASDSEPECENLNQARFVRLVANQFRKPFRLRRDRTLDHRHYGACFKPLSDKSIVAELKRWARATSQKDRLHRRLPVPGAVRKSLVAKLELVLQG